jgi:cobalamin biosynthesis protein CbiG
MGRKSIIITPEDKEEEKLLQQLIKRMGISGRTLSEEEMEDAGLALAMSKVDRTKVVSKERVLRKLRA